MALGIHPARSKILVGRDEELARLNRLLAQAAKGIPSAMLVRGEAGAGKTRLLGEFRDKTQDGDAWVLWGSCIAMGTGEIPYAPLVEALRRFVRQVGPDRFRAMVGDAAVGLASLVAGIVDEVPSGSAMSGLSTQSQVFHAILRLLDALGADRPVLLIIEDLQWTDLSTLDLMAYLAQALSSERLLLVGSYRTTGLAPRHPLRTLVAELGARRIQLMEVPEFGRPGLKLLLRAILRAEPSHDEIERVLDASDGNAFFVEELLGA